MQRGLGGFPHERLHQDKVALSKGATGILGRRCRGFPQFGTASRQYFCDRSNQDNRQPSTNTNFS
ncbi:hypothetical protein [Moorena sp. SIO4G3]|uniref:hypothetical protein n=1 Tax=Moorena sp. SIO4G3 TaxID=2607821 RepID=UPI00142B4BA4|nr:hypothetical protein [Moorena sp. SIO4G3]NEO80446.1 hypothetical protein [Moorena sp. SIO4G3]